MGKSAIRQRQRAERRIVKARATGRKVLSLDLQRAKDKYPKDSRRILEERARDKKLELDAFTSVGGYPLYYLTRRDGVACPDCANEAGSWQIDEDGGIKAGDVNYEDASLICDFCNKRIESAYAEDEADGDGGDED